MPVIFKLGKGWQKRERSYLEPVRWYQMCMCLSGHMYLSVWHVCNTAPQRPIHIPPNNLSQERERESVLVGGEERKKDKKETKRKQKRKSKAELKRNWEEEKGRQRERGKKEKPLRGLVREKSKMKQTVWRKSFLAGICSTIQIPTETESPPLGLVSGWGLLQKEINILLDNFHVNATVIFGIISLSTSHSK